MDQQAVRAAFDEQIRRHPVAEPPSGHIEVERHVVRSVSATGWTGVTWSGLDSLDRVGVDATIAAQVSRFAELGREWEWKYYSYDQPADLPDRLRAAGFAPEPAEALLVAEVDDLAGHVSDHRPPAGIELREVVDARDVEAFASVHHEVFGQSHSSDLLLAELTRVPATAAAVIAVAGQVPVAAGRMEFHPAGDFASLWGGGTLAAWRGRGVFRALVAYRAALAAARGFRYLQVDARPASRRILRRLGFVELATTIPFIHPGTSA